MTVSGEPGAPITFEAAQPGTVVITGADLAPDWTEASDVGPGVWALERWQTPLEESARYGKLVSRCEGVIVDGRPMRQVLHPDALVGGTFCYDRQDSRLLLNPAAFTGEQRGDVASLDTGFVTGGQVKAIDRSDPGEAWPFLLRPFDPSRHRIEVVTRGCLFKAGERWKGLENERRVDHLVLRGLTFRHGGTLPQHGMVAFKGSHVTVEDCRFEFAAGVGLDFSVDHGRLRDSTMRLNGQLGLAGNRARNTLVERCTLAYNNTKHSRFACFENGGTKICRATGWTFRACRVIGNDGPGIWFDIDNRDCSIERCHLEGNAGPGIMYEISAGGAIRNNVVVRNGWLARKDANFDAERGSNGNVDATYGQGILVQFSVGCRVYNNTVVGNRRCGVELRHHPYQQGGNPGHAEHYVLADNEVFNNIIADNGGDNVAVTPRPALAEKAEEVGSFHLDHNLYHDRAMLSDTGGDLPEYARWGKTFNGHTWSMEEWRVYHGQDAHSIQWDPFFVDPAGGDYRLESWSPAIGAGRVVEGLTDDHLGRPRRPGLAPTIGALEGDPLV